MSKLIFKKGSESNLSNVSVTDGQLIVTTDTKKIYLDNGGSRLHLNNYPVTSVNGKTGAVNLTYTDVGAAANSHNHTSLVGNNYTLNWGGDHSLTPADRSASLHFGTSLLYRLYNSTYYQIYDTGNKPSYSDIGAAAAAHTHDYISINPYLGYYNLIPCSDLNRYNMQGFSSNGSSLSINTSNTYDGCYTLQLDCSSNGSGMMGNYYIRLKKNTLYTYSCMIYSTIAITMGGGTPLHTWVSSAKNAGHEDTQVSWSSNIPANTWTRAYVTLRTPNSYCWFLPFLYGLPTGGIVRACQFSLVEGEKVPTYSPICIGDFWQKDDRVTNAVWN